MTPSSPFSFGDVVILKFPFTNQTAFKQRPGVIVSTEEYNSTRSDVVVMAITSQVRDSTGFGEAVIDEWQAAHLLKPSTVKPVFANIERGLILRVLGSLQAQDRVRLKASIAQILG